jgi:hypothetical protein
MKLSAKTGVSLTITALSLVVTVGAGAGASDPYHAEGLANDQASAGMTEYSGGTARILTR